MMKFWLPISDFMTKDNCLGYMNGAGSTFIVLNEDRGTHPMPTLLTDINALLSVVDPEDIGEIHLFSLCTYRGREDEMMGMLDQILESSYHHVDGKYKSHIIDIDPDADPDEIDSSIWQRLIPWIPVDGTRATLVFTNVIYGDESMKLTDRNRNIDVTPMGRTLQKIVAKVHQMNGNAFIVYNQEVTGSDSGKTTICVI